MINEISTTRDLTKITNNMGSEAYKKVVERNLSPTLKLTRLRGAVEIAYFLWVSLAVKIISTKRLSKSKIVPKPISGSVSLIQRCPLANKFIVIIVSVTFNF